MPKVGYEHIKVVNSFKGFHINYIVNMDIVLRGLVNEFDVSKNQIKTIAELYNLIDIRHTSQSRHKLPTFRELHARVCTFVGRKTANDIIRDLIQRDFIIRAVKVKAIRNDRTGYLLDIGHNGSRLIAAYSTRMQNLYRRNYYTDQIDNELTKLRLLQEQQDAAKHTEEGKEIPQPTPRIKDNNVIDIDKIFE